MKTLNATKFPPVPSGKSGWPWTEDFELLTAVMPSGKPWPKISIVTPSYNQGQYLEETIRSVLLQRYPNIEYIIIDGGSTDGSIEVIKKYEEWLTYWVSEPDKGQSDAINKGIAKCTGNIFNWLCSDDYLERNSLIDIAKNLEDEGVNVCCGISRLLHCDGSVSYAKTPIRENIEKTISVGSICQPSTYFKFEVIRSLGYLRTDLHYGMDSELWVKYLLRYGCLNIIRTDTILVNYRYHEKSKSVSQANLFDHDFNAIRYSVLELFNAPKFVKKYYFDSKINNISKLSDIKLVHSSIVRKKIIACYLTKSRSDSFRDLNLSDVVLNLIYSLYLEQSEHLFGWVGRRIKR